MMTLFNTRRIYNGTFTIKRPDGTHTTIKISTSKTGNLAGKRIVSQLVGPDNNNNYVGFGFADEDRITVWRKQQYIGSSFMKYADEIQQLMLNERSALPAGFAGFQLLESRACYRCNRKLTTPMSIESGIGPECSEKLS